MREGYIQYFKRDPATSLKEEWIKVNHKGESQPILEGELTSEIPLEKDPMDGKRAREPPDEEEIEALKLRVLHGKF